MYDKACLYNCFTELLSIYKILFKFSYVLIKSMLQYLRV